MNEPITDAELDAIDARAERATPGPWGWYDPPGAGYGPQLESEEQHARWGGMACLLVTAEVCSACRERGAPCLSGKQEDKDFIAHARTDIPALIAALKEERAENERLRRESRINYKICRDAWRLVGERTSELNIKKMDNDALRESARQNLDMYRDANAEVERLREELTGQQGITRNYKTWYLGVMQESDALRAQLAAIRKAAESVIKEARLYDSWDTLKKDDIFKALRALAATINEGVKT